MRFVWLSATFASLAAATVCGCGTEGAVFEAQGAQALTAASEDDADPAVVAVVFRDDPTRLRCSGTLISERVVLTAAHCDVHDNIDAFEVFFGSDLAEGGRRVRILDAVRHPFFDETASFDLALLLLEGPPTTVPVQLDTEGLLGKAPVSVRLVGFGDTGPELRDSGRKREGPARGVGATEWSVILEGAPSLPCTGDSGAPVLVVSEQGERLGAVVSRGDVGCGSYGKATRVDPQLASFIEPYVAATAPASAAAGERCLYDEQCEDGRCLEARDEPMLRFCGSACEQRGCPDRMVCTEGYCRHPVPSPGAVGYPCSTRADCARGECASELGYCTLRCVAGRGDCPARFLCSHLGGIDFFCTPAPPPPTGEIGGGCTLRRPPGRLQTGWFGLVLVAVWIRRVRGR